MSLQTKYFLIAVISIGSIGIWLPIGIEALVDKTVTFHSIPPNVTTYFVSILFAGCIDYFLSKLRQLSANGIASVFINLIALVLLSFALVVGAVILNVFKQDGISLFVGLIGVGIAFRIWWIANIDNPNFYPKPTDSLGSDPSNQLSNG